MAKMSISQQYTGHGNATKLKQIYVSWLSYFFGDVSKIIQLHKVYECGLGEARSKPQPDMES